MNFLRKLFPLNQKKNMASDTNGNSLSKRTLNISDDQIPIQPYAIIHSKTLESNDMLYNKKNIVTHNDSSVTHTIFSQEKDSSKTRDIVPISVSKTLYENPRHKIHVVEDTANLNNITHTTKPSAEKDVIGDGTLHNCSNFKGIEVMPDETFDYSGTVNNLKYSMEISALDDEILQNINNTSMQPKEIEVINDASSDDTRIQDNIPKNTETSILKHVLDDETLQNLKEFEDTLNNFDKTACVTGDLIDLDEFNEIFDNLDAENDDSVSQVNTGRNILEHNENDNAEDLTKDNNVNPNYSKINSNTIENIDIISISSTEEFISQDILKDISIISSLNETQNSDDNGYNSSDFEFISETEANMDGFIVNFNRENDREIYNVSPSSSEPLIHYSRQRRKENDHDKEASDPGEGPSGLNTARSQYEDRSYRNNHRIPEGDDYLGLFQGIFNPILPACEIYFMENKSVRTSAMNFQYDGIGFDKQLALRRPQPDSSEEEFEDEAKECAKKILKMYPGENRKRRRRY